MTESVLHEQLVTQAATNLALVREVERLRAKVSDMRSERLRVETELRELRAEVARCHESLREAGRQIEAAYAERDTALARVAEYADTIATGARNLGVVTMERDAARAEVERLKRGEP